MSSINSKSLVSRSMSKNFEQSSSSETRHETRYGKLEGYGTIDILKEFCPFNQFINHVAIISFICPSICRLILKLADAFDFVVVNEEQLIP